MSRWLVLLLLAAPALAANPYDASPGRIDLFYGNHGVGMATLPGSAAGDAVDAFVGVLHAEEQGALLGARVYRETGGSVACQPLFARFGDGGPVVEDFGIGCFGEVGDPAV